MPRDKGVMTRSSYTSARVAHGAGAVGSRRVTRAAEQKAFNTGKLDPLVDPAGFGVIRLSLPRFEKVGDLWKMLVGVPMPVETRIDTTSSMGDNVDIAMDVLPNAFESWGEVLPGYDLQIATGIFGDVGDRFILCRPQFEMDSGKIVKQLTLMVPERGGGDFPEDPDYGIFGGAYLVRSYANRIGLKGYDFTVTDAPGRGILSEQSLARVFGPDLFESGTTADPKPGLLEKNGHRLTRDGSYQLSDVWEVLLNRAHAFVLQVGSNSTTRSFWTDVAGKERVVQLPDTKYLPYVQAAIIGLTEGTLTLAGIAEYLGKFNIPQGVADGVAESLVNIPVGAQSQLPNFSRRPQKDDMFAGKPDVWEDTNLWPCSEQEHSRSVEESEKPATGDSMWV